MTRVDTFSSKRGMFLFASVFRTCLQFTLIANTIPERVVAIPVALSNVGVIESRSVNRAREIQRSWDSCRTDVGRSISQSPTHPGTWLSNILRGCLRGL